MVKSWMTSFLYRKCFDVISYEAEAYDNARINFYHYILKSVEYPQISPEKLQNKF